MFVVFLIQCLGRVCACLPDVVLRAICVALGGGLWWGPFGRRKVILSNLRRAFPEKNARWRRTIGRESCNRLIEMGLFVLVSPYFSQKKIRARFQLSPALESILSDLAQKPHPLVIMVPHFSLMESITLFPAITDKPLPKVGVLFRPLNSAALDSWVQRTRERWGIRLFSRKDGLLDAANGLHDNGALGLLFDQNAGGAGVQSLFLGRLCSTSELTGMMTERFDARVGVLYAERTGFFRANICAEEFTCPRTRPAVVIEGNRWLERRLAENDNATADWLWAHNRWGRLRVHSYLEGIWLRKSMLDEFFAAYGTGEVPDKDHYVFTLPEDAQTLDAVLPILRRLKEHRSELHITALAIDATIEKVRAGHIADTVISRTGKPLSFFRACDDNFPMLHMVLDTSARADREAAAMGALIRCGVATTPLRAMRLTKTLHFSGTPTERALALLRQCGGARYFDSP